MINELVLVQIHRMAIDDNFDCVIIISHSAPFRLLFGPIYDENQVKVKLISIRAEKKMEKRFKSQKQQTRRNEMKRKGTAKKVVTVAVQTVIFSSGYLASVIIVVLKKKKLIDSTIRMTRSLSVGAYNIRSIDVIFQHLKQKSLFD